MDAHSFVGLEDPWRVERFPLGPQRGPALPLHDNILCPDFYISTAPEGGDPLAPQVDVRLTGSDEVGARPELTLL